MDLDDNGLRAIKGLEEVDPKISRLVTLYAYDKKHGTKTFDEVLEKVESNDETTVQHIKEEVMKTWKRITGSE